MLREQNLHAKENYFLFLRFHCQNKLFAICSIVQLDGFKVFWLKPIFQNNPVSVRAIVLAACTPSCGSLIGSNTDKRPVVFNFNS